MITEPTKVLFVCLGNICRSPIAEGVFRHKVIQRGVEELFEIDSAGTGAWHAGEPPDRRMRQTARAHGISIDDLRARRVELEDMFRFDHILAMDRSNYEDLRTFDVPDAVRERVQLFRAFDPHPEGLDVPDPYYGGSRGFEQVYDIVSRTCDVLLMRLAPSTDKTGEDDQGEAG